MFHSAALNLSQTRHNTTLIQLNTLQGKELKNLLVIQKIPHIETPNKEVIKQKLLEHNVLTEALNLEMKSSNQAEKRTSKRF